MPAQPVDPAPEQPHDPGYDPAAIFQALPPRFRKDFRADYDAALEAAHDFDQFKRIREVLHLWRLRSVAYSHPHYEEAIRAAKEGRDEEFVGADQIPGWAGRL
ncbi:DUF6247 family protein [Actinomadura sp. NBRC 104425]|uniref:DUF6247 family protein n=1 Tax=Actinomadura sp. NBRC 104425 TaxID=3032204 RepID=UPI0025564FCE|nr:DUF6247 family protein [Actinomadura sp. NBRC 104425]